MNARVIVVVLWELSMVHGVTYTRCQLAKRIADSRVFEKTFLGSWVCLIEKESNRDTALVVQKGPNQNFYGLFQIPQRFCGVGRKGGECNVACEDLLQADVLEACRCAQHIWTSQGFKFWSKWQRYCNEATVRHITEEIYKCPDMQRHSLWRRISHEESMNVNKRNH